MNSSNQSDHDRRDASICPFTGQESEGRAGKELRDLILGGVPLVLASGAGAHGRILLGLTVLGGMLAASLIAIFLIPVCFYVVENLTHRGGHHEKPKPSGSAPGDPRKTGDGELAHRVPRPALTPTPVREGGSCEGGR